MAAAGSRARQWSTAYAFVLPVLGLTVLFSVVPLVMVIWRSLQRGNLFGTNLRFAGLADYRGVFSTGGGHALVVTLVFTAGFVLACTISGLAIALLLDVRLPGLRQVRALFIIPLVVPAVATAFIWFTLFQPDTGLFNRVLSSAGLPQVTLDSPRVALVAVIGFGAWQFSGEVVLLYLAALKALPGDVLEAALVDGASAWQRLRHVRLPLLWNQTVLITVIATLQGLQAFTQIYVLTDGGPSGATQTALYYVYQEAFGLGAGGSAGLADAMSVILFAISIAVTISSRCSGAAHRDRRVSAMRMRLWAKIAVYVLVAISVLLVLFPLAWMVLAALKTNGEIIDPSAPIWPRHPQWSNLPAAWNTVPFGRFFINTAIFAVVTTAGQIATGMLAGYAFAVFGFPLKRVLFVLVLSGLMIPFTVVLVPVVKLLAGFGWIDTYQGLIVPNLASALGAFLFRQFFLGAPGELGEAARIDGASEWRIFFSVYRPLAKPMTAAFTIIAFLNNWNNFLFPLVVTSSEKMMMLSQGLTIFQGQISRVTYNLLMAGSVIAVIPVLAVAMILQRRVVEGLTLGAVRG